MTTFLLFLFQCLLELFGYSNNVMDLIYFSDFWSSVWKDQFPAPILKDISYHKLLSYVDEFLLLNQEETELLAFGLDNHPSVADPQECRRKIKAVRHAKLALDEILDQLDQSLVQLEGSVEFINGLLGDKSTYADSWLWGLKRSELEKENPILLEREVVFSLTVLFIKAERVLQIILDDLIEEHSSRLCPCEFIFGW